MQVRLVQDWWSSEPTGPTAAARSPMLSILEASLLAELIAAGGGYHTILSADRLDALHRQHGSGTDPALEPLRKALRAGGGSKGQARAVGMLLFREARALREQCLHGGEAGRQQLGSVATPARAAVSAASASPQPSSRGTAADAKLDEAWTTPRRFVPSEAYPPGAQMAARAGPSPKAEIVGKLPADFVYLATGRAGEWLQVQVDINGAQAKAYVLHTIGGQVMLVPAAPVVCLDEAWSQPRRWVRAEGYPEGAQMAARSAPSKEGKQIATLPPDFEYFATGRSGDYLQVHLDIDGVSTTAYVLHALGDLVLLKPATAPVAEVTSVLQPQPQAQLSLPQQPSPQLQQHEEVALQHLQQLQQQQDWQRASETAAAAQAAAQAAASAARAATDARVEALEAKVSLQDRQIQVLQAELRQLRSQLTSAACALAPSAAAGGGCGEQRR